MIDLPVIRSGLEIGIIDITNQTIDTNSANSIYFQCTSRVECCSKLKIPVTEFDIQRIENAGYDLFQIIDSDSPMVMNRINSDVHEKVYTLKKKPYDNTCTFLENNLCKIHKVKPFACRIYPFSLDILDKNRIRIIIHNDVVCKSIQSKNEPESNNRELLGDILKLVVNELKERGIQVID